MQARERQERESKASGERYVCMHKVLRGMGMMGAVQQGRGQWLLRGTVEGRGGGMGVVGLGIWCEV